MGPRCSLDMVEETIPTSLMWLSGQQQASHHTDRTIMANLDMCVVGRMVSYSFCVTLSK